MKAPADSASGEIPLPGSQTTIYLFALSSYGGRCKESLGDLFYKGTSSIDKGSTLMT